jgi:drug/metabolite transporter (DMT)-like permease
MSIGESEGMKTNRRHAVAALIAAGLLWGTTVPLSKLALGWLSPGWLTAVRFGLAAAILLAAAGRRAGQQPAQRTARKTALREAFTPAVLIAGAFGYGGSVMVQNAGIIRTSVTHAALLIGAVPVLVAIIAAVWYRTVARPVAWFGFAVSLGGVGLVTAGGGGGGAALAGDGLVLLSLLLSATVTVAQGRLLTGRDPVAVTAVQFLGAALGSLPVAAIAEGAPAMPGGIGPVLAVVALAGAGTLAPFTLFAFGQSRVPAEVAGAFLNLEPLVGALAGAVVFGDPVGLAQVAGGLAILAGIALSSLPLFADRRVARRAAEVVAATAAAGSGVAAGSAAAAGASEGAATIVDAGASRAGVPSETRRPPNAGTRGDASATPQVNESGALLNLLRREPLSSNSSACPRRRNEVFVGVRGSKFGAPGRRARRERRGGGAARARSGPGRRQGRPGPGLRRPGRGRAADPGPASGSQGRGLLQVAGQRGQGGRLLQAGGEEGQGRGLGCGA